MPKALEGEEIGNIFISVVIVGAIVIAFSIVVLWVLTNNFYLDAYYTIETFFDTPNTAASFDLAQLAFNFGIYRFAAVVVIVIVDNISKMLVISFIIAAVLDIISYANVEEAINRIKARSLSGHVIVCGYNQFASDLIKKLARNKIRIVVVDHDPKTIFALGRHKVVGITGRFTESENLEFAGIGRAKSIVFTSESDLDNLSGAITAKRLNSRIKVMSRVSSDDVRTKMYRVGVDMCVLPEYLAGVELGENLLRAVKGRDDGN
jgi:voltage-gated potassium channel